MNLFEFMPSQFSNQLIVTLVQLINELSINFQTIFPCALMPSIVDRDDFEGSGASSY